MLPSFLFSIRSHSNNNRNSTSGGKLEAYSIMAAAVAEMQQHATIEQTSGVGEHEVRGLFLGVKIESVQIHHPRL